MIVQGGVRHPFHHHRRRQHRPPVHDVRPQKRVAANRDRPLERHGEVGMRRVFGLRQDAAFAQNQDFDRLRRRQFVHKLRRAVLKRNQADVFPREQFFQRRRHHAARPRPPIQRNDAAIQPPPRFALRDFVQRLVRHRVIRLPNSPEPSGCRGEEDQTFQGIRRERVQEIDRAVEFRADNALELRLGFFFDAPVRQDARAVNQAGNRAEFALRVIN